MLDSFQNLRHFNMEGEIQEAQMVYASEHYIHMTESSHPC